MGEGWETARRRDDGNDQVRPAGRPRRRSRLVEIDTATSWATRRAGRRSRAAATGTGRLVRPAAADPAAARHPARFRVEHAAGATHVRLDVFPDGGLARLRLFGELDGVTASG